MRVREQFLFTRNGFKFQTDVKSKTSQFQIDFKSLARFNKQFRVKETFELFSKKVKKNLAINPGTVWQQKQL